MSGGADHPDPDYDNPPRNDMINPKWMEEEVLGNGPRGKIPEGEVGDSFINNIK